MAGENCWDLFQINPRCHSGESQNPEDYKPNSMKDGFWLSPE
ncbi:MAG: hypothetical protein K0R25_1048 [Rickettsiaceae bacterium]|jgi:hypothetical protein|nr:hypothetical protein [Rickettsiaceae bacterium]